MLSSVCHSDRKQPPGTASFAAGFFISTLWNGLYFYKVQKHLPGLAFVHCQKNVLAPCKYFPSIFFQFDGGMTGKVMQQLRLVVAVPRCGIHQGKVWQLAFWQLSNCFPPRETDRMIAASCMFIFSEIGQGWKEMIINKGVPHHLPITNVKSGSLNQAVLKVNEIR